VSSDVVLGDLVRGDLVLGDLVLGDLVRGDLVRGDLVGYAAHPQYSIDCNSIEHVSEGSRNAP
jgi:hypothetical protein